MPADLLFELGCEEIPARMLARAAATDAALIPASMFAWNARTASSRRDGVTSGNSSLARDATYASAHDFAIARTRPMKRWRSVTLIAPRASSELNAWLLFMQCSYAGSTRPRLSRRAHSAS